MKKEIRAPRLPGWLVTAGQTLAVAFGMFSALPVPQPAWNEKNMKYALCAFPLVGAVIALAFGAWGWLAAVLGLPELLRAAGFPVAGPEVITCPTCGRTQYPCTEIANEVERRLQGYKKSIKVAVMGCVVNGPGEAREADIGIAGGKGEAVLFVHGQPVRKLTGDNILDQFMEEIYKL